MLARSYTTNYEFKDKSGKCKLKQKTSSKESKVSSENLLQWETNKKRENLSRKFFPIWHLLTWKVEKNNWNKNLL